MRLLIVSVLVCSVAIPKWHSPDSQSLAEARSVSRLCDRVPRRAYPGLDTDLSGLGLSFSYPGNVRLQLYKPGSAANPTAVGCRLVYSGLVPRRIESRSAAETDVSWLRQ